MRLYNKLRIKLRKKDATRKKNVLAELENWLKLGGSCGFMDGLWLAALNSTLLKLTPVQVMNWLWLANESPVPQQA